jgi:hypothetical protein
MSDEPKPPTDAELDEMEVSLHWAAAQAGDLEPPHVSARLALQLVAEIRRLRSRRAPDRPPIADEPVTERLLDNLRSDFEQSRGEPESWAWWADRLNDEVRRLRAQEFRLRYHHAHDGVAREGSPDLPPIPGDAECATCREHDALTTMLQDGKA